MGERTATVRGVASRRDWTQGSIIRNLWSLSWPIIITQVLIVLSIFIDVVFVARLGAAVTAGVGIGGVVVTIVIAGILGLAVAARAIIARFVGAGQIDRAERTATQAFVISALYGVAMAVIGVIFAEQIMSLFGLETGAVAAGATYVRVYAFAWTPVCVYQMNFNIMQASGDTATPMKIIILIRVLHLLLAPFLIFGWWLFPRMEVTGAALTSVITTSLAVALTLIALLRPQARLRLTFRNFRFDFGILWRILKIGLPASVMGAQNALSMLVLASIIASFGTLAVAGYSIVQRVDTMLSMVTVGLGIGASVLVGQNLGAGQPGRAERTGWLAVGLGEGIMAIIAAVLLLTPESIVRIFSSEPNLVQLTSTFFRIIAARYLLLSVSVILQNTISGAGDTLPAMFFSVLMLWGVQVPLAFLLRQVNGLGVYGVIWAIVAGMFAGAIAFSIYFRAGRWKRKRV
jgi:putative MATE family efflux protein